MVYQILERKKEKKEFDQILYQMDNIGFFFATENV